MKLLSSTKFNSSSEGDLTILIHTVEDLTLKEELPSELQNQVASEGIHVQFAVPVVSSEGSHAAILLAVFASGPFLSPYVTNYQAVRYIDNIHLGDDFVTLTNGSDVMHIVVGHEDDCHDDADVGAEFDHVTGKEVHISSFPAEFDWGCGILPDDVCFCKRLEDFQDAIDETNGEVCIKLSGRKSRRCPASMRVNQMTGVFREAFPFLADMVPVQSFESEWLDREQDIGITFPCF